MEPLVTVLISSYNQGAYITECLNSVLNQSYKNLQVIVVEVARKVIHWKFFNPVKMRE